MEEKEDLELKEIIKRMQNINKVAKGMKKGTSKEINCTKCGGIITICKNNYNGHICAKCNKCDFLLME